jgi:RHS repeat-associated protein
MEGGAYTYDAVSHKFTGKERDSETNLDNFGARFDASQWGRFMSPDPLGGHQGDPQTLNKYVYVRNNPLNITDPTGLDFYLLCTQTKDNGSTCQQQKVGTDSKGNAVNAYVQGTSDKDGNFTATQTGNDANGNLVDKTTGSGFYTGAVDGSGVQFA